LERLSKRDIYENGAKPYEDARGRPTLPSWSGQKDGRAVSLFNSIALTITLTPKADLSPQYLRWGVLIGEIAHNIGSALDNLVWELAQPLPPTPPPTASSKVRAEYTRHLLQLGFPYTKQRLDWAGNCARYLHFVADPAVRTVLEEAQAFYAWENERTDPETFPLEVIHELWNRDKHHTVNVAAAGLAFQVMRIRIPSLFPGVQNLPSQLVRAFPIRPLEGETEMAVVLVSFPHEIEFPPGGQLELKSYVNPSYTLAILFGQGSPAEGWDAIDRLQRAHELASQVVSKFS
jgi:hypothetical protein